MFSAFRQSQVTHLGDATRSTSAVLRVLVGSRPPTYRVGYADQLVGDNSAGGTPDDIEYDFRHRVTVARDVDVVHLTASSAVLGDRRTPQWERVRRARRLAKSLQRERIALVRTVLEDGREARDQSRADAILDAATAAYIVLTPATSTPKMQGATVIGHSHLRDRFLGYPRAQMATGRLLLMSADVLQAAHEPPLKVFGAAELPDCTLRVVGTVPPALEDSFARTASLNPSRVSIRSEALSDAARVEEVTAAELVIVTSPASYESTHVIMMALSLDRPVLVENTTATRLLADEVGHRWVRLHDGRLTAATLEAAVDDLRSEPPIGRPDLDARAPNIIAAQYVDAFRAASASR